MKRFPPNWVLVVLSLVIALGPASARAEKPTSVAQSPQSQLGTLASLASQLGERLQPDAPALVVVGPVQGEALGNSERSKTSGKPRWADLHARVRLIVGSAVPSAASRHSEALSFPEARRQARQRGAPLVYLAPLVHAGQLQIVVDWVQWSGSFWQRSRMPEGIVRQHLSLGAPIDAEVRSFFPRPARLVTERKSYVSPVRDVLALSCGRDSADRVSVVLVGRHEIVRGRFSGARFEVENKRLWDDLSPLAPAPLRAPLAAARFVDGAIEVGSSDRAYLVRLDAQLRLLSRGPRAYPLDTGGCVPFSQTGVGSTQEKCAFVEGDGPPLGSPPVVVEDLQSFGVRVESRFSSSNGLSHIAKITQPSGTTMAQLTLLSSLNAPQKWPLAATGSAVALGDLDGDGVQEVIRSAASRDAGHDVLRIESIGESSLVPRSEIKLPAVHAVGVCPFDEANPVPVIVATADRLWVFS